MIHVDDIAHGEQMLQPLLSSVKPLKERIVFKIQIVQQKADSPDIIRGNFSQKQTHFNLNNEEYFNQVSIKQRILYVLFFNEMHY